MSENPLRRTVNIWLCITVAAIVMIFIPGWLGIDGFDGGFAISFASILGVMIGLIVVFVYRGLASRLDGILRGEGVLAKWSYTPEQWAKYTEKEFGMEKEEAMPKFYIVAIIAIVVGVLFYAFDPEGGIFVLGAMVALIAIIGFTAWASTRYMHGQNIRGVPEAVIARNGVYLNRRLYYWDFLGTRLEKVASKDEKGMMMLHFVTWAPTMTLGQTWDIRVPIPPGEEAKAEEIASQLNLK
ncbi:MAG: hypothetical protein NTV61_01710 [Candidatus Bathyarchaeota archaeon]|nr:hypothetical protein [Candidatus Bathyarchaeota archaeon]